MSTMVWGGAVLAACAAEPEPELALYRDRTREMLRRYFRMSIEVGRLPSLVGREFFRSRVTHYKVKTFEDSIIFVHDVETCLERLDDFDRRIIGRVVLEDWEHEQAARNLGCTRRTLLRRLPRALDRVTELFLDCGLLNPR